MKLQKAHKKSYAVFPINILYCFDVPIRVQNEKHHILPFATEKTSKHLCLKSLIFLVDKGTLLIPFFTLISNAS